MNFRDFYFGYRGLKNFNDEQELRNVLVNSKYFNKDQEIVNPSSKMLLFAENDIKSWLIKTNKRVYKVYDDKKKERPIINWSLDLDSFQKLLDNDKIFIKDKNDQYGYLIFGNKPDKKYKFEKDLCTDLSIIERIRGLFKKSVYVENN
jgi:hypothetical protein